MKEPPITPEIAEAFARAAMEVKPGDGISRAYAVGWLPSEFRDKATWTHQKETAEMLLSALVGAGAYAKGANMFYRKDAQ